MRHSVLAARIADRRGGGHVVKWPWATRVADAVQQEAQAEDRRRSADQLVEQSRWVSASLRHELAKNGWTDLLQQAMGGR